MNRPTASLTTLLLCIVLVGSSASLTYVIAECTSRRPPNPDGQVPPTGRIPPPPTDDGSGGSTGTDPGGGAATPGPSIGALPPGPAVGPRVRVAAGSATTPGRRRKSEKTEDAQRWEIWWAYNRDPFLDLKARLRSRTVVSGSADWLLGDRDREAINPASRPGAASIRDRVVPALREALAKHESTQASAVLALAKTGDPAVHADIVTMLAERGVVKESAALALGVLGMPQSIPLLRSIALSTDEGRRAVRGVHAVPFRTRAFAATGLGLIDDPASAAALVEVIDAARKEDLVDLEVCAVASLGMLGKTAHAAMPALVAAIENERVNNLVRAHAVVAASKIGSPAEVSLDRLIKLFRRENNLQIRGSVILALGRLATPEDHRAVRHLVAVARKGADAQSRTWACIALGRIGGREADKLLKTIVVDGIGSLRSYAALGLGILARDTDDQQAAKLLRRGLRDAADISTKGAFAIALGILGDRGSESVLAKIVTSRSAPSLRGNALVALGLIGARSALPVIEPLLRDPSTDPTLAYSAALALGMIGDSRTVGLLTDTLAGGATTYVRGSAARALGLVGDRSSVEPLIDSMLGKNKSDTGREYAATALGTIADARDLPFLHVLAVDSNYRALVESLNDILSVI